MKIIKYFDTFTQYKLIELENNKKTYLKRLMKQELEFTNLYAEVLDKIRNYNVSNFKFNNYPYDFYIIPDDNFIEIIKELNSYLEDIIPLDLKFNFSYNPQHLNIMDFKGGIPKLLRGLGFGFKLYKFFIDKIRFVTTDYTASPEAINIWRKLMLDDGLWCFTSNKISGVINKGEDNEKIKIYLDKIKNYSSNVVKFEFGELIFDEELEEKIKEIYGSLDIYKHKN